MTAARLRGHCLVMRKLSLGAWASGAGLVLAAALPALGQDAASTPDAGALVYRQRCQNCHALPPAKSPLGPSLVGVVGRPAASGEFAYSSALKATDLIWNDAALDRYIAAPTREVPGTRMILGLPDAKQRAAVIAYLATLR